jgi:RNA recognition motif-containing protein
MKLFIGNLSRQAKDEDLQNAFKAFGQVDSVAIIRDKFSGESRGFAFIEMGNKAEAEAAIKEMNGKELLGSALVVNEARPKPDRNSGGGFGGNRGGGGGYGGGGGRGGRR